MKWNGMSFLSLFLSGAMILSSFSGIAFAEETMVISEEIAAEDPMNAGDLIEEQEEIDVGTVFETQGTRETETWTEEQILPSEDVFADVDGLIEDMQPEETLSEETEQEEEPSAETEEPGEQQDFLISDEEAESEEITEEMTEELTETETEILEEENLEADLVSGSWTYTVSGSKATITGYTGSLTNLSIPTSLGGKTVTAIKYGAFAKNTKLVSVSIPSTVTAIGDYSSNSTGAFQGCSNLSTVTLGTGTSDAYIGKNTFQDCVSLKTIVIPGNYTAIQYEAFCGCTALQRMEYKVSGSSYANQEIGERAFYDCSSLTTAIIPRTVKKIGTYAFYNNTDLTSLTLNEGLQTIGAAAFAGCIKLPSVTMPSTVTAIGDYSTNSIGAFQGCKNLLTVTIGAGTNDAYIGKNTFQDCVSLKTIVVPGNYTAIQYEAFCGCTALQRMEYKVSGSSYANQEIGENAFYGCSSLTTAIIPKTVKKIGTHAFYNNTNLTSLTLNEGLQTIGAAAFAGCIKLSSVTIPSTVTAIGDYSTNSTGAFQGCSKLAEVTIKAGTDDAYIGKNTFQDCVSLKTIVVPGNYTAIQYEAFCGCTALQRMEYKVSGSSYANQEIGENAFYGCSSLTTAIIPKTVKKIGTHAFYNNTNLTSLTLNEGLQTIGAAAFAGCIKLPSVTIPSTVTAIGDYSTNSTGAFQGCSKLAEVTIKAGTDDAYIGKNTFQDCVSLKTIVIPGNYTAVQYEAFSGCTALQRMEYKASSSSYANQEIGESAFCNCSSLSTVIVPGTVSKIGAYAFSNSVNLTSLTLNEGLKTIAQGAFAYCSKLSTVTIPSTVTVIGSTSNLKGAFEGCSGLTRVTIKKNTIADECTLGQNTFRSCTSLSYVYIPATYTTFVSSNIFANRGISLSIWGEWGSVAETFADANGIPFNEEGIQLGVPGNILAINRSSQIEVRWDTVQYADQYIVLRSTNNTGYKEIAKVNTNRYYDSNVTAGNIYEYSIKAVCQNMPGSYRTNGAKICRLNMPIVRSVVNVSSGLQVTWNQVTHASYYAIYRRTLNGTYSKIATVSSGRNTYLDTSVRNNAGVGYRYTVRAVAAPPVTSISDCRECSAIRLLTPSFSVSNTSKGIKLNWNKITGASGYTVYRKTKNTAYTKIATVNSGSAVTYTDTSVKSKNGTEYIYTVRAINGNSISVGLDKTIIRLTAPSVTSLTNYSYRKLTCKWSSNTKATRYQLQYATNSSFSGAKTISVGKTLSYTLSGLTKGKRYYIRVRAVRETGNAAYISAWSSYSSIMISK